MTTSPLLAMALFCNYSIEPMIAEVIVNSSEVPKPILVAMGYDGQFRKAPPMFKGTYMLKHNLINAVHLK